MPPELVPIAADDPGRIAAATAIWNAACGPDLAVSERFVRFNLQTDAGVVQAGRLAMLAGEPAGFVLAGVLTGDPTVSRPDAGFLDALAVHPGYQGHGVGSALLDWATAWLADRGCRSHRLGGGLRPFVPGLPIARGSGEFFRRQGYTPRDAHGPVWDVARDLSGYQRQGAPVHAVAEPAQAEHTGDLLAFLRREFDGRWRYECEAFLAAGGRLSDYLLLWAGDGGTVAGFCRLTFKDSLYPLDRFYPWRLPRPWGQLGPIGVSAELRGQGLGAALLEAGLLRLAAHGVAGCVIDWTHLVDFYAKFGFTPYRGYYMLHKRHG